MNLHRLLEQRRAAGKPVRVGLIGAGKFGSMFLAQVPHTPGLEVVAIADLDPARAEGVVQGGRLGRGADRGRRASPTMPLRLIARDDVEVVIEATGHPPAGIATRCAAIGHGKHIVMVNVEADVLAGPLLAAEARQAGVVYSLAYGDQPALICGDGGLGARLRLRRRRRRQGHEVPAGLSRLDAGRRSGPTTA